MINNMWVTSHLCAVNPEGAERRTRPDLQPVVGYLITRVKGLDLNDFKKLQQMQCIQESRDLVLNLEAKRNQENIYCEVVEGRTHCSP